MCSDNSDTKSFFDPDAPGLRGMIGLVLTALGVIFERATSAVRGPLDAFRGMPARARSLTLILMSLAILILVAMFLTNQALSYIEDSRRSNLDDTIAIPFDLQKRAYPGQDTSASNLAPEKFGGYTRLTSKLPQNAVTHPVITCLIWTSPGEESLLEVAPLPTPEGGLTATPTLTPTVTPSPMPSPTPTVTPTLEPGGVEPTATTTGRWDLQAQAPCRPGAFVTSRAYGRYLVPDTQDMLDVAVVRYPDEDLAIDAMFDLLNLARSEGNVGNFAVAGITSVDYFYGSANGTIALTWRKGPWVFAMSARRYRQLEAGMNEFPY